MTKGLVRPEPVKGEAPDMSINNHPEPIKT